MFLVASCYYIVIRPGATSSRSVLGSDALNLGPTAPFEPGDSIHHGAAKERVVSMCPGDAADAELPEGFTVDKARRLGGDRHRCGAADRRRTASRSWVAEHGGTVWDLHRGRVLFYPIRATKTLRFNAFNSTGLWSKFGACGPLLNQSHGILGW